MTETARDAILRPLTDDPSFSYEKLVRETWIVCQGPKGVGNFEAIF